MAVTIDEMHVEVAPEAPVPAANHAKTAQAAAPPDVMKTLALMQERKRRLKAD